MVGTAGDRYYYVPLVLFGMYLLVVADGIVVVDLTMLMTNGLTRMEWHQSLVDSVFRVGVWKALLHCIPMLMANGLSRGECHHSMGMTMEPCQPNNSSTCQAVVCDGTHEGNF